MTLQVPLAGAAWNKGSSLSGGSGMSSRSAGKSFVNTKVESYSGFFYILNTDYNFYNYWYLYKDMPGHLVLWLRDKEDSLDRIQGHFPPELSPLDLAKVACSGGETRESILPSEDCTEYVGALESNILSLGLSL
jgi:hypothetical protein